MFSCEDIWVEGTFYQDFRGNKRVLPWFILAVKVVVIQNGGLASLIVGFISLIVRFCFGLVFAIF